MGLMQVSFSIVVYMNCLYFLNVAASTYNTTTIGVYSVSKRQTRKATVVTSSMQTRTALHCCLNCVLDDYCLSASYDSYKSECILSNDGETSVAAQNWTWYKVEKPGRMPSNYCFMGSCYLLVTDWFSWYDSKTNCESLGGHLADLQTSSEVTNVKTYLATRTEINLPVWIGLNDLVANGDFRWSDDSPVTFGDWDGSNPDNKGGEDCVEMFHFASFQWNDGDCMNPRFSLCEQEV